MRMWEGRGVAHRKGPEERWHISENVVYMSVPWLVVGQNSGTSYPGVVCVFQRSC